MGILLKGGTGVRDGVSVGVGVGVRVSVGFISNTEKRS